jgi:hypothetical protein
MNHPMRALMMLAEGYRASKVPRLWLGPKGEAIDLNDEDVAHSLYVLRHQELFGIVLSAEEMRTWEEDGELQYDLIIARAEANGWVRTSGDTHAGGAGNIAIAVSASNAQNILKGVRWIQKLGFTFHTVQAEIETLIGDKINQRYYHLTGDVLDKFLRRGVLPHPLRNFNF